MLLTGISLLLISGVMCSPRSYKSMEMCNKSGSSDCSFQIGNHIEGSCRISNTLECESFDFSSWIRTPIKFPQSQKDFSYIVEVYPYPGIYNEMQIFPVSSVNVTFSFFDEGINGFLLLLSADSAHLNICRIFDFRNVSSLPMHKFLFYDCIKSLLKFGVQNFNLTIRALPNNDEMKYYMFVPEARNMEPHQICLWKPLIMVFVGGLKDNVVELKFSQAPLNLNVSKYEVSLISKAGKNHVFETTYVESKPQGKLLGTVFSHVDKGYYSIGITPISSVSPAHCIKVENERFFVETKLIGKTTIAIISAVVITGIIVLVASLLIIRWLFKAGPIAKKPFVLLVYSYDCDQHQEVVETFAKYLEQHCWMTVHSIYGSGTGCPDKYLHKSFVKCDIVLLVISKGVWYKIEKSNRPPMQEGHTCGNRFSPALSYLNHEIMGHTNKKFVKIVFEYSENVLTPECIQPAIWGKTFKIPREMNRFLCLAHNQCSKVRCLKVYPLMPGHDVNAMPTGIPLNNKIEKMKQVFSDKIETANAVILHSVVKPKGKREEEECSTQLAGETTCSAQEDNSSAPLTQIYENDMDLCNYYDVLDGANYHSNVLLPILPKKLNRNEL